MWQIMVERTGAVRPADVYRCWSHVAGWPAWNPGVAAAELHGEFAAGGTVRMQLPDGTEVPLTLAEVVSGESFTDVAELDGIRLTTQHRVVRVDDTTSTISYHLTATGAAPDEALAEIGADVSADFAEVIESLLAHAPGAT